MSAVDRNPHAPYIEAVVDAMTGVPAPTQWWYSDAETGEDGETCTLSAVLAWGGDVAPDVFPCGMILCWDLDREWQYAELNPDGSNTWPEDLPLPLWADPADVAASARALLRGDKPMGATKLPWRDEQVLAAVKAWVES